MSLRRPRHLLRWIIGAVVVVIVLAVGGPFVYIHFINGKAPASLSLNGLPTTSAQPEATTVADVAGTWSAGKGSVVGYRVGEVLLGQSQTAVGRTSSVTGHLSISGTTATAAAFTVPMSTVHSNESARDAQFDGRIMDVAQYPNATFTLTQPISLAPLPKSGIVITRTAHGTLQLHGQSRAVTFTLTTEIIGGKIEVAGHIPVTFADWGIQNPSAGSFVTTKNYGTLEFLLVFTRN